MDIHNNLVPVRKTQIASDNVTYAYRLAVSVNIKKTVVNQCIITIHLKLARTPDDHYYVMHTSVLGDWIWGWSWLTRSFSKKYNCKTMSDDTLVIVRMCRTYARTPNHFNFINSSMAMTSNPSSSKDACTFKIKQNAKIIAWNSYQTLRHIIADEWRNDFLFFHWIFNCFEVSRTFL